VPSATSRRVRSAAGGWVAIAGLAASLYAAPARAGFVPYPGPFDCDEQARTFLSLKSGTFDYCRLRLRYTPGRWDCLRIVTSTCNVWVLDGPRWVLTRSVDQGAERIACPAGPAPPSCPAGYDGGAIPKR
jgi:hypothetical protein